MTNSPMIKIKHHNGCSPNYPEKPEGESPQEIVVIDIGAGEEVHQCGDCGAYIIVKKKDNNERH